MTIQIKLKNEETAGKSFRVQSWNGTLPTYDSEQQRGAVQRAQGVGDGSNIDNEKLQVGTSSGSPLPNDAAAAEAQARQNAIDNAANPGAASQQEQPDLTKMKKDELVAHAESQGVEVNPDEHTKAQIIDKINEKQAGAATDGAAAGAGVVDPSTGQNASGGAPVAKTAEEAAANSVASAANPVTTTGKDADTSFNFTPATLLQEQTFAPGEEKVITISSGMFITIKEDA